jgi:hypothetical protein
MLNYKVLTYHNILGFSPGFLSQVLSHSWEWIERNDGYGLLSLSEEGLEAKQGYARNIRKHNCFQGDVMKNLTQCFQQLHLQGDMVLNRDFIATTKNVKQIRQITSIIAFPQTTCRLNTSLIF